MPEHVGCTRRHGIASVASVEQTEVTGDLTRVIRVERADPHLCDLLGRHSRKLAQISLINLGGVSRAVDCASVLSLAEGEFFA